MRATSRASVTKSLLVGIALGAVGGCLAVLTVYLLGGLK